MPAIRSLQPLPIAVPGLSVTTYGTSTAMPCGISTDRSRVYGANPGTAILYESTNDGTSWTSVHTFAEPVVGLLETDDGEAICLTQNGASTPGYMYKSSGWTASHTAATWTKVLTSVGGYFRPYWDGGHFCSFGNSQITAGTSKYGVTCEYGNQTTASGDQSTKAIHVYFTSDYGTTWTTVLDLSVRYPGVANLHTHAAAYDPYWDRIWLLMGDVAQIDGASAAQILYSDDHGATWSALQLTGEWAGTSQGFQSTSVAVLPACVIFGSDNQPGFVRLPRHGYRKVGDLQVIGVIAGQSNAQMIATSAHRNRTQPGAPLLLGYQSTVVKVPANLMVSLDGGESLARLWGDSALAGSNAGVMTAFGPTSNGKILAQVTQTGGANWLLVGELILPDPGLLDGSGVVTGDGTTTSFSFPHGLSVQPSVYLAWAEKPAASAITVSATATNIVLTFATAPANASTLPIAWRARA